MLLGLGVSQQMEEAAGAAPAEPEVIGRKAAGEGEGEAAE